MAMEKRNSIARLLLLSTTMLTVLPVKCNSILDERRPKVADDGYEYVTTTGSLVPQRVKKGTAPVTTSPVDVVSGESLNDYRQKNQGSPKLPGGATR